MLAAIQGHTAVVQKLLRLGASPALKDRHGLTASQQARRVENTRIAELVEAAVAP